MDLVIILSVLAAFLVLIALSEPLALRLRVPQTVALAGIGIAIGAGAAFVWTTDYTDLFNPLALAILNLPIRSNVFLYVFLPTLIFQVTLSLDLRRMLDDWVPILTLAVLAVGVATVVVGFSLYPLGTLPLTACLLIGAIVSTTDPSAVVSIFRATPAPQRLARIVEGESLLNDAAAIALFGLFLGLASIGVENPSTAEALWSFPGLLIGGGIIGWLAGLVTLWLVKRLVTFPLGQISVTVALPYAAYILSEQVFAVSGVVAVVSAGLTVNLLAAGFVSPPAMAKLRDTWDLLAYWAGGLIFVLAAILIPRLMADVTVQDLGLILVTVLAAFVARAIILFGLMPLLSAVRASPRVEPRYRVAILWGGLRGAVTLALALAVTESFRIPPEIKREVGIIATGFTLFTLIVQGTTLRWVIAKLGLDRLSALDVALSRQVVAVALQTVREQVAETARDFGLSREIVRDEAKRFAARLDDAVDKADLENEIPDRDRITLGLMALAGRERDLILETFRDQVIPPRLADRMLTNADRLLEATRAGGRSGYRTSTRRALSGGQTLRSAEWLHNRLRLSRMLTRITADRFELIVTTGLILPQLHEFINHRILRIHGRRVADLLHELVNRRQEETQKELDGLRLQYPGYAEDMERRLIRRTALQLEEREYDQLTEDGLIGPELRSALAGQIGIRRERLSERPRLDLRLQKAALVRLFPLFADMEERPQRDLARRLRTVYAAPGDVLMRRDDRARRVWFIASGAVEVVTATNKQRLGRGEMFGQLAMLARTRRRAQVTAITHCTLLALEEARFLDLMQRNAAVHEAVLESAARRGVKLDLPGMLQATQRLANPAAPAATATASEPASDPASDTDAADNSGVPAEPKADPEAEPVTPGEPRKEGSPGSPPASAA
ncbi:cation:proton antiporter [Szabonella alba]|uniref:Cation:proton antiporter n=1 Tax=Szabonella alba TaxID=2804194 RepID=A0A8K0VDH6_9RHOB|nr:cation:proton antiporter [Szabonella alba]MBL4917825.1 cation:proton antiporter [Szabonella alba]